MSSRKGKAWSIEGRLTLFYALSAFGLLSLVTGFLYFILVGTMNRETHQALADEIRIIRSLLRDHVDDTDALEEEIQWESFARGAHPLLSRVLDGSGVTIIETPGMDKKVPAVGFAPPVAGDALPGREIPWTSPSGQTYALTSAWAQFGADADDRRLLQVAVDVTRKRALIAEYRRDVLLSLFFGVLLSALAGAAVARRGMRPLATITRTARGITASELHQRIGPERWPGEFAELAAALDGMLGRLEDAFKRLSQFSADLAHELRTPINNLVGETEVALSRARTPQEYHQVLESNLEEYGRLSQMIKNMLFLARAEGGGCDVEKSTFDARREIEAVVAYHEAVAEEQRVQVTCRGDAKLNADPQLFRRALSNLLSNALQYTSSGAVDISVESGRTSVDIRVKDTGLGIEPQHLPKIYDRFYRGDPSRSKAKEGTGLGLAIVRSIMDLHGGSVRIESEPGRGTTATLTFLRMGM
jgi:two-component system, OmpR family, heavy metal sensor histidine kinase CusS